MGGGGGNNSAMINFQKQQAAQARQKEIERAARLKSGSEYITSLFDGSPKDAKTLDLSGIVSGKFANKSAKTLQKTFSLADGFYAAATPDNGDGSGFGVFDASNNLVAFGKTKEELAKQKILYGGDPTVKTGGFGSAFYDKFKQANLDYYMPELERQYANSKSDLSYGLARSGTLRSSTAGDKVADLSYNYDVNKAQLSAKADSATAELRNSVAANKSAAINQLYATEDPSLAASTATAAVRNVELTKPTLDPIGQLFSPIAIGIGQGMQSYQNAQNFSAFQNAMKNSGKGYN